MKKYPRGPKVRVTVTQEQITRGVTADSTKCMISEAIKVAYPSATSVATDLATVRFSDLERGHRYVYLTPYPAQLALLAFDEGTPPAPFSFTLGNAHVTRAGSRAGSPGPAPADTATPRKHQRPDVPLEATMVPGHTPTSAPRLLGGKRPPQLKVLRKFGVKAFRGASEARLRADAELKERADAESKKRT